MHVLEKVRRVFRSLPARHGGVPSGRAKHVVSWLAALCLPAAAADAPATPPSIVVLFSDDAGHADFGFQRKAVPALARLTPRLNTLAEEGLVFDQAYVCAAVCSPSRAGLFTGRHPQRFGHETNIPPGYMKGGLPLTEKFIGDHLRPLGHATGLIGKWHLGYPDAYHPNRRGFDHFHGLLQGARPYFPQKKPHPHRVFQENGKALPEAGYVTDRIGDAACEFIRSRKGKPFFLFVSFTTPHSPLQPKPEDLAKVGDFDSPMRAKYAALVKSLDDNCGKILDCLAAEGLADNTLVVFSNDNGGQTATGAVNTPLRGAKGQLYEGGIRVPMVMRWPGVIAPGRRVDTPVSTLDWLPTFLAAAGGTPLEGVSLDGLSLLPLLKDPSASLPPRPLFWRSNGPKGPIALREGDWKLIDLRDRQTGSRPELYRLSDDLSEKTDLAGTHPEKLKELQEKLAAWEATLVDPLW